MVASNYHQADPAPVSWRAWLGWGLAALIMAGLAAAVFGFRDGNGYEVYVKAAGRLFSGHWLMLKEPPGSYNYPPVFTLLTGWLVWLPEWLGRIVWNGLNGLLLVANLLLVVRLTRDQWESASAGVRIGLAVLCLALALRHLISPLDNGSYDYWASTAILGGLWLLQQDRPVWGCLCWGLAAAIKITPAFLLIVFLVQRRWKEAVLMIVFAAAFFVSPEIFVTPRFETLPHPLMLQLVADSVPLWWGDPGTLTPVAALPHGGSYVLDFVGKMVAYHPVMAPYVSDHVIDLVAFEANPLNQSLAVLLRRVLWVGSDSIIHLLDWPTWLVWGCIALAMMIFVMFASRAMAEGPDLVTPTALALCLMLLFSPMSSKSHFVVVLLPCALAVLGLRQWPGGTGWRRWCYAAVLAAVMLIGLLTAKDVLKNLVPALVLREYHIWGPLYWFTVERSWAMQKILSWGPLTWFLLGLVVMLVLGAARRRGLRLWPYVWGKGLAGRRVWALITAVLLVVIALRAGGQIFGMARGYAEFKQRAPILAELLRDYAKKHGAYPAPVSLARGAFLSQNPLTQPPPGFPSQKWNPAWKILYNTRAIYEPGRRVKRSWICLEYVGPGHHPNLNFQITSPAKRKKYGRGQMIPGFPSRWWLIDEDAPIKKPTRY
jgi:hypothetical protein